MVNGKAYHSYFKTIRETIERINRAFVDQDLEDRLEISVAHWRGQGWRVHNTKTGRELSPRLGSKEMVQWSYGFETAVEVLRCARIETPRRRSILDVSRSSP
jgi:hypothetical protein